MEESKRCRQFGFGDGPQIGTAATCADKKEAARAIKVPGSHADDGFDDHVAQQVKRKATFIMIWKRSHGGVASQGVFDHWGVMEAGQQRKIVHRIACDGVIKIDEGRDLGFAAQDVPEGQILVNQAAAVQLEQ